MVGGRGSHRQRRVLLQNCSAMVRDREKEAGGGASGLLVVEFAGVVDAAFLCHFRQEQERGFHTLLCFYMDSLPAKHHHSKAA